MVARKKKSVTKNSVIAKTIESSVSNLMDALEKVEKSVATKSAESKKMLSETRRLKKRRQSQMGKKKRAIAAEKKNSSADARKAVRSTKSELAVTSKALIKATTARQGVLAELSGLKDSQKKLRAYAKSIAAADKQLARKPKRRKAKR